MQNLTILIGQLGEADCLVIVSGIHAFALGRDLLHAIQTHAQEVHMFSY